MSKPADRDYVLGTHDDELARLGLQHRVWRPTVLECWQRAGLTVGSRVLDVGAGPGFATVDLAELVGPTGAVHAVERSARFVEAGRQACAVRGLTHAHFHELDLMNDPLPTGPLGGFDASWCRWVASFVASPRTLIEKIARAVSVGGVAIFHEYINYSGWQFAPKQPLHTEFIQHVMASWREAGGEPDIAAALPSLLAASGFRVREAIPRVFCIRPSSHMWQWPSSFINVGLDRLCELGRVDNAWTDAVRHEFNTAAADPNTLMITPTVLEIVAERLR